MTLDRAEQILADKRIRRWADDWRAEIVTLTSHEREVLMTLVALLDARPVDELAEDR